MYDVAIIYRRTSTGKQPVSLELQDAQCDAYCKRNEFTIIESCGDPYTSSKKFFEKRDGGKRLLDLIQEYRETVQQQGSVLHVVVLKQDRLGRDTIDQIQTIRKFWKWGVMPHIVNEGGAIPKTPTNELIFGVKASTNQYERDTIRERIKDSLDFRRAQGRALYNIPPYGWDAVGTGEINPVSEVENKKLVPNELEQQWLRKMNEWRSVYKWSYGTIAKELNTLGVPTKIPAGTVRCVKKNHETGERQFAPVLGKWTHSTVQTVLTSRYAKELFGQQGDKAA